MRNGCPTGQDVDARQADVFRMFVGQGKRISYAALQAATGVSSSTWKSYAHGVSMPLENALRLISVLPMEAGNMLIEPCGHKLVPLETAERDWLSLAAHSAAFASKVLTYQGTDGFIDHSEESDLIKEARALAAEAQGASR
jgi:hypothetical protein